MEEKRQMAYMVTFILSPPSAKKCLSLAKERGITDILVLRGKGTVSNRTLQFLGIKRQDKVLLNMLLLAQEARSFLNEATEVLALHKPNHGIAFFSPIERWLYGGKKQEDHVLDASARQQGEDSEKAEDVLLLRKDESEGMDPVPHEEETMQYKKLTVVVNLGMAEDVMTVVREAGAKGGTILHGRGTGAQVSEKLFGIEIEPEKELLLILAPEDVAEGVAIALEEAFNFTRPGTGILYVEAVSDVRGLVIR